MPASSFAASLSEDAGERAGIALNKQQLIDHLAPDHPFRDAFMGDDRVLRVASDDYADTVGDLLFALGAAEQPGMPSITQRLIQRLGPEWKSRIDIMKMMEVEAISSHYLRNRTATGQFDTAGLEKDLEESVGAQRDYIINDLMVVLPIYLAQSPYYTRSKSVGDAVALTDLFASENLPTDGSFFDQRFIDYLHRNPETLKEINWRQFEGLSAEWLSKNGFDVELGPGRDDGGVDVRAWNKDVKPGTPPAIIVQCKREKNKIGKVVVKALWADVHAEKADSGLLVTTSDISPGAAKVIEGRAYPVTVANGKQVREWVREMSKPAAGIIL